MLTPQNTARKEPLTLAPITRSIGKHAVFIADARSRRERRILITLFHGHDIRSTLVTTSFWLTLDVKRKGRSSRRKRASRSLGEAESKGCSVPPRTIRSRLGRPQCAKIGAYCALGLLEGRCHPRAGVGKRSRVSAHRRIMRASARVTMEVEAIKS
jgi:hypothetical protein